MIPLVVLLAGLALPAAAQSAGPPAGDAPLPPSARTRSDVNMYLELHNMLMVASRSGEGVMPDFRPQITAYQQAREMSKDPAVWRLVSDACVIGPDIAAVGKAAETLPASMAPADREAARLALGAIASAWGRFESQELVERRRSLQLIVTSVLKRRFSNTLEERLLRTLLDKLELKPVDAPITIYPVIHATEAGAWGRTPQGYYLVIPAGSLPQLTVIENLIHELTHLLDANQPPAARGFLVRLREKAAGTDPATLDQFMHGLVSWNAGEMIRRFVNPQHKTYAEMSPERKAKLEKFIPAYEASWIPYLEGRSTADQAIAALAAAAKSMPPAAPPGGGRPGR